MQAIMSDQRGSYLESSGNGFFIGRVLLARYIDGPGDEGRATPLHDQKYPGRDPPPRESEPICKVGFGRDHGGRYPDERWLWGDRCDLSLPLEGITYGCKRLDTGGSKLPETPPVTAQIMHPFWDCNLLVKLGASSVPALNCATPPVGVLSPPIAMCAQPIAIAAQSR
jgi:hypothetical protein